MTIIFMSKADKNYIVPFYALVDNQNLLFLCIFTSTIRQMFCFLLALINNASFIECIIEQTALENTRTQFPH